MIAKIRLAAGRDGCCFARHGADRGRDSPAAGVCCGCRRKWGLSKLKYNLRITASIGDVRYCTLVLTDVTLGRPQWGDLKGAGDMLGWAERLVSETDSSYVGLLPRARIAGAYAKIGLFETAMRVVEYIGDDALRARLYWSISGNCATAVEHVKHSFWR